MAKHKIRSKKTDRRKINIIEIKCAAKERDHLQVFIHDQHPKTQYTYQPQVISAADPENTGDQKILPAEEPVSPEWYQEGAQQVRCDIKKETGGIIKQMQGPDDKLDRPDDQCPGYQKKLADLFYLHVGLNEFLK
jgi:hypothetical protein